MDRETIKKYRKEFDHWLDGGEIQYRCDGKWLNKSLPQWVYNHEYRIKPEPVTAYIELVDNNDHSTPLQALGCYFQRPSRSGTRIIEATLEGDKPIEASLVPEANNET